MIKDIIDIEKAKQSKCRYWNRGYCKELAKCLYGHKKKIIRPISTKKNVKIKHVKEDT